ncbi:hypothetical protein PSN45_002508 [Yamadazyma tenuis]|uniref:uncharacterized protein n=1 Tax=Candida tenuis TaxID=2315449 RepID=UPI00279B6071|nr:hypothetical protein PSN45_002508 [Yamadazyma tenuis]
MYVHITSVELLKYHRESYDGGYDSQYIRQFILQHEQEMGQRLIESDPHHIHLGELEVDAETFDSWEYDEHNPQVKEYLRQQSIHKQRFLLEVHQRGLKVKPIE